MLHPLRRKRLTVRFQGSAGRWEAAPPSRVWGSFTKGKHPWHFSSFRLTPPPLAGAAHAPCVGQEQEQSRQHAVNMGRWMAGRLGQRINPATASKSESQLLSCLLSFFSNCTWKGDGSRVGLQRPTHEFFTWWYVLASTEDAGMSLMFSTPGGTGIRGRLPLGDLYGMGQEAGKGVTGTSLDVPLCGAAVYVVTICGRLQYHLPWCLQGGCHSCSSPLIIQEGTCFPWALPRQQGCASPSLGNRFSTLIRG